MKHPMMALALAALVSISAQTLADDGNKTTHNSADKAQMMKACMDKQKAMNTGTTQAAMKTVCKNEVIGNGTKDGNDLATGTKQKADAPNQ